MPLLLLQQAAAVIACCCSMLLCLPVPILQQAVVVDVEAFSRCFEDLL